MDLPSVAVFECPIDAMQALYRIGSVSDSIA